MEEAAPAVATNWNSENAFIDSPIMVDRVRQRRGGGVSLHTFLQLFIPNLLVKLVSRQKLARHYFLDNYWKYSICNQRRRDADEMRTKCGLNAEVYYSRTDETRGGVAIHWLAHIGVPGNGQSAWWRLGQKRIYSRHSDFHTDLYKYICVRYILKHHPQAPLHSLP